MRLKIILAVLILLVLLAGWVVYQGEHYHPPEEHMDMMRGDLRNLAGAQEQHLADHGRYSDTMLVRPFDDETVITIIEADSNGWSALATMADVPWPCGIYVGDARPVIAGSAKAGEASCGNAAARPR
jgi:hypothetical protein